jgi:hypothetical protein
MHMRSEVCSACSRAFALLGPALLCLALPSCFLTVVCAIHAALKTCWAGAVEFFGCCVRAGIRRGRSERTFSCRTRQLHLLDTAYSLQPDFSGRKKHHERTPLYRAWQAHWTVKGIPSDFYYYHRPRQRQAKALLPALPAPNLRRDASEAIRSADRPAPRHHTTPVPATSLCRTPVPTCDVLASYYLRLPRNISS